MDIALKSTKKVKRTGTKLTVKATCKSSVSVEGCISKDTSKIKRHFHIKHYKFFNASLKKCDTLPSYTDNLYNVDDLSIHFQFQMIITYRCITDSTYSHLVTSIETGLAYPRSKQRHF